MSILNAAPGVDVRKVMSGKDGALYDDEGTLLVSVESFQSQVAITNQTYQPLGTAQERSTMTSYKVTLTMTEIVVTNSKFFQLIMEGLKTHAMPVLNFRAWCAALTMAAKSRSFTVTACRTEPSTFRTCSRANSTSGTGAGLSTSPRKRSPSCRTPKLPVLRLSELTL